MKFSHYRPDLSVKYSPRISRRLRRLVTRVARKSEMSQVEILRYCFEAAVLSGRLRRFTSALAAFDLDAMVTIYTGKKIGRKVQAIFQAHPNAVKADILRALLESMLLVADKRGMAHVMSIREKVLGQ